MAIKRDETGGGHVKLVLSRTTWQQLCRMAGVECDRATRTVRGERVNVPVVMPREWRSEATFWVCAAMVLGNADAMMLAAISNVVRGPLEEEGTAGEIWFDGLELF